jgi:hypothetical protein
MGSFNAPLQNQNQQINRWAFQFSAFCSIDEQHMASSDKKFPKSLLLSKEVRIFALLKIYGI